MQSRLQKWHFEVVRQDQENSALVRLGLLPCSKFVIVVASKFVARQEKFPPRPRLIDVDVQTSPAHEIQRSDASPVRELRAAAFQRSTNQT